jgi:hypothetical protein
MQEEVRPWQMYDKDNGPGGAAARRKGAGPLDECKRSRVQEAHRDEAQNETRVSRMWQKKRTSIQRQGNG